MIKISYAEIIFFISIIWCLVRGACSFKNKGVNWKRELQLILVYICIIVIARFTFFPFSKVNGEIQPLVFEKAKAFPFRINFIPFVHLFDYPNRKEAVIEPLNLAKIGKLTFAEPDYSAFPLLMLSRRALRDGGAMGAVLEAADSRAVEAYFNGDISFGDISDTVISVYEKMIYAKEFRSLEEILKAHSEATGITDEIIRKKSKK